MNYSSPFSFTQLIAQKHITIQKGLASKDMLRYRSEMEIFTKKKADLAKGGSIAADTAKVQPDLDSSEQNEMSSSII